MSAPTRSQRLAQTAFARVKARRPAADFVTFAKKFPALIHTCGLAQAVAFARAKQGQSEAYADDLAAVLTAAGHATATADALARATRELTTGGYLRLSRDAIDAAVWLKRYVEALSPDTPSNPEGPS